MAEDMSLDLGARPFNPLSVSLNTSLPAEIAAPEEPVVPEAAADP